MEENYYQTLGLPVSATREEIRKAYRKLAKIHHPDAAGDDPVSAEKFKKINEAYTVLMDQKKRDLYDVSIYDPELYYRYRRSQTFRRGYGSRRQKQTEKYPVGTRLLGTLFVVAVLSLVFGINILLIRKSSSDSYRRGVMYSETGNYPLALASLDESIQWFGSKNAEAGILAAEILLYKLNQPGEALLYIKKGLRYADSDENLIRLYFLNGRTNLIDGRFEESASGFESALALQDHHDSSLYYLGVVHSRHLDNPDKGIQLLTQAIAINDKLVEAYLQRGIAFGAIGKHRLAASDFGNYLTFNKNGDVYALKAIAEIEDGNIAQACDDLSSAGRLGSSQADSLSAIYCK